MKIHTVHFRNLNSLYGTWSVDLRHPEYEQETLFMISGPTGSGKTTLLDAICLALYGKTPRLETISKSTNEAMSNQTGECFAEVTFSTAKGLYRAHWSQHRARKQADGDLQQPRHELVDGLNDRVLETGIRNVARTIEEKTGMDFKQFTRSVLLAQGRFAEFLQATADERAPLLEQITGTELYSDISIHVHKRTAREQERLAELRREVESIAPLEAEARSGVEAQAAEIARELRSTAISLERLQREKQWLERIEQLEQETAEASRLNEQLAVMLERETPSIERLDLSRRARRLQPALELILKERQQLERDGRTLSEHLCRIDELDTALAELKNRHEDMETRVDRLTAARDRLAALLKTVRLLDRDLAHAESIYDQARSRLEELDAAVATAEVQLERTGSAVEADTLKRDKHREYFSSNPLEARLPEELGTIRELIAAIGKAELKRRETRRKLEVLDERMAAEHDRLRQAEAAEMKAGSDFDRVGGALQVIADSLASVLRDDTLTSLVDERVRLENTKRSLTTLAERHQAIDSKTREYDTLGRQLETLREDRRNLEAREQELGAEIETKQAQFERLSDSLGHSGRLRDFEEARTLLQRGKPCPLCGSVEHPYADAQTLESASLARRELDTVRTDLEAGRRALAAVQTKSAVAGHESARLEERRQTIGKERAGLQETGSELTAELPEAYRPHPAGDRLHIDIMTGIEREISSLNARIEAIEANRREQHRLAGEERQLRQRLAGCTADRQRVQVELDRHSSGKAVLRADEKQAGDEQQALRRQLEDLLAACGLEGTGEMDDDLVERLSERVRRYKDRTRDMLRLEGEIDRNGVLVREQREQLRKLKEERQRQQERADADGKTLEGLRAQRRELFGDKDPDSEEAAARQAREEAAAALEQLRRDIRAEEMGRTILADRVGILERSTAQRREQLSRLESRLREDIRAEGFDSEEDFRAALLPDKDFEELQSRIEQMLKRQQEQQALLLDKQRSLAAERNKALSIEQPATITEKIEELTRLQAGWQRQLGAAAARLEEDDVKRARVRERLGRCRAQEREVGLWLELHALIGSSDGKKFRNFAQGITFEQLLANGNERLAGMSERYQMAHSAHRPLEIDIIDLYQAGMARSTKNLSGGESFIVSLALALGLSAMTSNNIQVDSLFLDEGFGTLDEDSLEIALAALSGLRTEGKLIGVISHVSSLRERIPTRIDVLPGANGRSTLAGPGIARQ